MLVKIYAIVVTFNLSLEEIEEQYNSLVNQVAGIVYVDNGSQNIIDLKGFHKRKSFKCICLYNKENLGLSYAQNLGIAKSFEYNPSHVLILDQDSILEAGFVSNLLDEEFKILQKGIKLGAIGPISINKLTNEQYSVSLIKGLSIKRIFPKTECVEASFIISSGSLIRVTVLNEVGLMDESLFIDGIDVEWAFRSRSFGYKLYITPNAKMLHLGGDRSISANGIVLTNHSPLRQYYMVRNSILLWRCNYIPIFYRIRIISMNFIRIPLIILFSSSKKLYYKYCMKGLVDGLFNRRGESSI